MSLFEPRCLVCGNPFGDRRSAFKKSVRESEVCSDECYVIYMTDDDGVYHGEEGYENLIDDDLPPVPCFVVPKENL